MDPRRVLLVAVVVVGLVAAVQLLDPFEPPVAQPVGEAPSGDEPAAVLRHGVAQLNATSYTLTVRVNDSGTLARFSHSEVNYTDRELSLVLGERGLPTRFYFNANGGWVKHPTRDWRHGGVFDRRNRFGVAARSNPYRPGAIHSNRTRFHNTTADALWIRVEGARQNDVTNPSDPGAAYTLYEVDPETYRIRRSVEFATANDAVRNVYEFEDYGRTSVSRPPETKSLWRDLIGDLLR